MANEFEDKIVRDFMADIVRKLDEAAIIARTAYGLGKQGLAQRAFTSLLGIETLLHDARTLVNATSVVPRREHAANQADPD